MKADADVRAYDAVANLARGVDLAGVARAVLWEMARTGRASLPTEEQLASHALAHRLSHGDATTPFGNALEVLRRGPEDEAERALARGLAARALLEGTEDTDRLSADVLWLAAHTAFDATGLIDHVLGERALPLWEAVARRLRRIDGGDGLGGGEALVAAAALAASWDDGVREGAARLASQVHDAKVARVLTAGAGAVARGEKASLLRGELSPPPRGPVATVFLAVTGVMLAAYAARVLGRVALAYRKPAEVSVSEDGGVRVRWRTELLGRTLRDGDTVMPRASLVRATREVKYPRAVLYAGLGALGLGSYLGVSAFVDGVRAASPSLLGTGLAVVALGLIIDFALSSVAPSVQGKCRLVFVSRDGRTLCVGDVETPRADALLTQLSQP